MGEDTLEPQLSKISSANMTEISPGIYLHTLSVHGRVAERHAIP